MKKVYLNLLVLIAYFVSFGQDNPNIDVGLFPNGSHGSNAGSGGYVALGLRIKSGGTTYTVPNNTAQDFIIFLTAPKTDFDLSDPLTITQVNPALYGTTSTLNMTPQSAFELGGPNLYFPIVLNTTIVSSMNLSPLTTNWQYTFTFNFGAVTKTSSQINKLKIVGPSNNAELLAVTGDPSISVTRLLIGTSNQLTGTLFSTLPVNFINFSGFKNGSSNELKWTTGSESNSRGFDVQRASDGTNYASIGFVNTQAPGGASVSELSYSFDDNSPLGKKSYYRLRQVDIDSRSTYSNIIIINGDKPKTTGIGGVFPNPANDLLNVIVDAPQRGNVTLALLDMNGKTVSQKLVNVETGSNTVPVDIAQLAKGNYFVKVIDRFTDGESAVSKFVKQ